MWLPHLPITGHTQEAATHNAVNIQQLQHQVQQFLTLGLALATKQHTQLGGGSSLISVQEPI